MDGSAEAKRSDVVSDRAQRYPSDRYPSLDTTISMSFLSLSLSLSTLHGREFRKGCTSKQSHCCSCPVIIGPKIEVH